MCTGSKNAVHNGICKAEGNAQAIPVAVTHKEANLHAHGAQGIVHRACSCPETLRLTREEEFYARPHIHEMPCRSKGISTIVAAAGKDNKHLVLRSADHCRSLFRRPPPCILHQGERRKSVSLCDTRINTPHILCKRYFHRCPSKTQYAVA